MISRLELILTALVVGCGGESAATAPTGTLKGKLTITGQSSPAKTGLVFQHAATGQLFLALTNEDGEYFVAKPTSKMPTGAYDVSIQPGDTEDLSPKGVEAALDGPKDGVRSKPPIEIPKKYRNAHESKLGFELQAGPNEKNFELK